MTMTFMLNGIGNNKDIPAANCCAFVLDLHVWGSVIIIIIIIIIIITRTRTANNNNNNNNNKNKNS